MTRIRKRAFTRLFSKEIAVITAVPARRPFTLPLLFTFATEGLLLFHLTGSFAVSQTDFPFATKGEPEIRIPLFPALAGSTKNRDSSAIKMKSANREVLFVKCI